MTTSQADFETTQASLARPDGLPGFSQNLVLVVGVGRSGTTALKQALGTHPQLLGTDHEAPLQRAIASAFGKHLTGTPDFQRFVRRATVADWNNVETAFRRLILEASIGDDAGRERLREEYDAGTDLTNITGWLAKIGGLQRPAAAGFAGLFPGLKPVLIHRNGIDTVQSRTRFGNFAADTFEAHCKKWALNLRFLRSLEEQTPVVMVRHEDLLQRPEELFERVHAELGLDPSPAPAEHARHTASHPTQDVAEGETIAEHFEGREAAHESWGDEQKRIFIKTCSKAMRELGYDIPFA